MDILEELK